MFKLKNIKIKYLLRLKKCFWSSPLEMHMQEIASSPSVLLGRTVVMTPGHRDSDKWFYQQWISQMELLP